MQGKAVGWFSKVTYDKLSPAGHPVFMPAPWNCSVARDTGSGLRWI